MCKILKMKDLLKILLLISIFIFISSIQAASKFFIVQKGIPSAIIIISSHASEKTISAAKTLQKYIEKISRAKIQILQSNSSLLNNHGLNKNLILVGKSSLTDKMGLAIPSGLTPARKEEGFLIYCKGNRLVLAGNDQGPYHGTQYAVYKFLNILGIRWFMPGKYGEYIPKNSTIAVSNIQDRETPSFIMRDWWCNASPEKEKQIKKWQLHNFMNPDANEIFMVPGDGSVRNIIPASEYMKEHPDYYALNQDGTRDPGLPNLSNPAVVDVFAENIDKYLQTHPNANSYAFAPDDGMPMDWTPASLVLNLGFTDPYEKPGSSSGTSISEAWFNFVNKVIAKVHKKFPDVYIFTNGYANRTLPPVGVKLNNHIGVMFAAIWCDNLHPYNDHFWQKNFKGQMIKKWCKLSPNVWIYNYDYQMLVSALTPLPQTKRFQRDIPLEKKWGLIGFINEARDCWAESGIAGRYLQAHLEWNTNLNAQSLLNDFYQQWYGPAALPMQQFSNTLQAAIWKSPVQGHEDRILPFVYTPQLMKKLSVFITKAEQDMSNEPFNAPFRTHVRAENLIYQHLKAYVEMNNAKFAGNFKMAVEKAREMLKIRKELYAISPFYMPERETYKNGTVDYSSGIWYWGIEAREKYYQKLADEMDGKSGKLIVLCPTKALFKTDPLNQGILYNWYKPNSNNSGWTNIKTTEPYYIQGYQDKEGYPYLGVMWYKLKVFMPASAKGEKTIMCIPTVEPEAWVWINGKFAGHMPYQEAYIRPAEMECNVTKLIHPGQVNEIAVRIQTLSPAQEADGILSRIFIYSPVKK
jgi:hypothetical protein